MASVQSHLSSNLWLALERLYNQRHMPAVEERFVGLHVSVSSLTQRRLACWASDPPKRQGFRHVSITPEGIEYYRTHLRYYRDLYPGLYMTSPLQV